MTRWRYVSEEPKIEGNSGLLLLFMSSRGR